MALAVPEVGSCTFWLHGGITVSTTAFNDTTDSPFTSSATMVTNNPKLTIKGAGAGAADFPTTATWTDSSHVATATNAGTTVAGVAWCLGTLVGSSTNWTTKPAAAYATAISPGDYLLACINCDATQTISTVADSGGNTWTKSTNASGSQSGNCRQEIWYRVATASFSAGTLVVTATLSGTYTAFTTAVRLARVTGASSEAPDVADFKSGVGTAIASNSYSTTAANEVVIAWIFVGNAITGTQAGYTATNNDPLGDVIEYEIFSSIQSSVTTTATQSPSADWVISTIGLKALPPLVQAVSPDGLPRPPRVALEPASFMPPSVVASRLSDAAPIRAYTSYPDWLPPPTRTHLEPAVFSPPPVVAAPLSDAAPLRRYAHYPDQVLPPPRSRDDYYSFDPPRVVAAHLTDAAPIGAKTSYPDTIRAPNTAHAMYMRDATIDPLPRPATGTPTQFPTSYPHAVPAPARPPSDWAPSGFASLIDDQGVDTVYPDRIDPPRRGPPDTITTVGAPERPLPYLDQDFPDRVRAAAPVAQQQVTSTVPLPIERIAPLSAQSYPDRVPAAAPVAQQHPAAALPLAPEAPLPSDWRTSYPDAVRAAQPVAQQQAALDVPPKPLPNVAAPTFAYWSYPDQILPVGGLRTAAQQDAGARNLPPLVYTRNWDLTSYPERVRAAAPVAQQQDQAARPLAPEAKLPVAYTSYPEIVRGQAFLASEQQHVAALPVKPEAPVPSDWYASYPDIVRGVAYLTAAQQSSASLPMAPELSAPRDWATSYQDRIDGRPFPVTQQQAAAAIGLLPVSTLVPSTSYPEIVRGRALHPTFQQAFAAPLQPPAPPVVPLYLGESYPDLRPPAWTTYAGTTAWFPDVGPIPIPPLIIIALGPKSLVIPILGPKGLVVPILGKPTQAG